jgi:hypothetical protein
MKDIFKSLSEIKENEEDFLLKEPKKEEYQYDLNPNSGRYRFKTKEELIDEYGPNYNDICLFPVYTPDELYGMILSKEDSKEIEKRLFDKEKNEKNSFVIVIM